MNIIDYSLFLVRTFRTGKGNETSSSTTSLYIFLYASSNCIASCMSKNSHLANCCKPKTMDGPAGHRTGTTITKSIGDQSSQTNRLISYRLILIISTQREIWTTITKSIRSIGDQSSQTNGLITWSWSSQHNAKSEQASPALLTPGSNQTTHPVHRRFDAKTRQANELAWVPITNPITIEQI